MLKNSEEGYNIQIIRVQGRLSRESGVFQMDLEGGEELLQVTSKNKTGKESRCKCM